MGRKVSGTAVFNKCYKQVTGAIEELPGEVLTDEWLNQMVRKYSSYLRAEHGVFPSDQELYRDAAQFLGMTRRYLQNKKNEEIFADLYRNEAAELGGFVNLFMLYSGGMWGSLLDIQSNLVLLLAVHSGTTLRRPEKDWPEYVTEVLKSFVCCLMVMDGTYLSADQRRAMTTFESGEVPLFQHL